MAKKKRTIAERQRRLDRLVKKLEYIVPLVVSSVAAALICIMVLC